MMYKLKLKANFISLKIITNEIIIIKSLLIVEKQCSSI